MDMEFDSYDFDLNFKIRRNRGVFYEVKVNEIQKFKILSSYSLVIIILFFLILFARLD